MLPKYGYYYFKPYVIMLILFVCSGLVLVSVGNLTDELFIIIAGDILILYGIFSTLGWLLARYVIPGNRIKYARNIISSLNLIGSEKVLDIGSGRGIYAIEVAKRLAEGRVIGIDIWNADKIDNLTYHHRLSQPTGNTIENAMKNAAIEGVMEKITFMNMDANHLEFEEDSFDLVICGFVIGHLWKFGPGILKEIDRVLKPSGRLMLVDSFRDLTYLLLSTPHLFILSYLKGKKAKKLTKKNWFYLIKNAGFRIKSHQAKKSIMVVECVTPS